MHGQGVADVLGTPVDPVLPHRIAAGRIVDAYVQVDVVRRFGEIAIGHQGVAMDGNREYYVVVVTAVDQLFPDQRAMRGVV